MIMPKVHAFHKQLPGLNESLEMNVYDLYFIINEII